MTNIRYFTVTTMRDQTISEKHARTLSWLGWTPWSPDALAAGTGLVPMSPKTMPRAARPRDHDGPVDSVAPEGRRGAIHTHE